MTSRVLKPLFFTIALYFSFSLSAISQPLIGMSFPPVKNQTEINFTLKQLNMLNISDIRIAENWKNREPAQGNFNWQPLENRIRILSEGGMDILLTIQSDGPDWACGISNSKSCMFNDWNEFEPYMKELLERIGPMLNAIQFGNEWDNQFVGSAEQFLSFQNLFYDLVKKYRPDLNVVLGGITTRPLIYEAMCLDNVRINQAEYRLQNQIDLNQFIQTDVCTRQRLSYAADLADVKNLLSNARYDIADIHLYDTPDLWPRFISSFKAMTNKPVYVTEFGGPNPDFELRDPIYQASRLATYLRTISQLPVERAYYFKLTDGGDAYHDLSGLFDDRGNAKPALAVFKNR